MKETIINIAIMVLTTVLGTAPLAYAAYLYINGGK